MKILLYQRLNSFILNNYFPSHINLYNGYYKHFIIGALLAGLLFHYGYKKTTSHLKSWIIALVIVSAIGLAKELIDPLLGRQRDTLDLVVTILGGVVGAGTIVLYKKLN